MAVNKKDRLRSVRRLQRVRRKIKSVSTAPRVSVFRSLKHIYAQIIDDVAQVTLVAASTCEQDISGDKKDQAHKVGLMLAERAKQKGIGAVVLDRGQYKYHGRLKALAEGLREGGIAV